MTLKRTKSARYQSTPRQEDERDHEDEEVKCILIEGSAVMPIKLFPPLFRLYLVFLGWLSSLFRLYSVFLG